MYPFTLSSVPPPRAPETTTLMRDSLIAYAHMMHGSTLV
jgi:hypothetical protein